MTPAIVRRPFAALTLLLTVGLLSCTAFSGPSWRTLKIAIRQQFPDVQQISLKTFEQQRSDRTLVVDVRRPEEYAVSHLQGAVNLQDADAILRLAQAQDASDIVVYCSVGYRSSRMAQTLQRKGWRQVANLEGSIFEWANSGRPVYRDGDPVQAVHIYSNTWGKLLDSAYHPDPGQGKTPAVP